MSAESLREQVAEALWCAIDDAGIEGRLTRPDCDFVANTVLALLGEVTVTEEWGVRHAGAEVIFATSWQKTHALERVEERPGQPVRRAVVTTRRVGEWEEVR